MAGRGRAGGFARATGGWRRRGGVLVAGLVVSTIAAVVAAVPVAPTAAGASIPGSEGPYLYDALGQFRSIRERPDAMGWYYGFPGGPEPTICQHWQGVARSQGPGPQYLFVTRSGNLTAGCLGDGEDHPSGDLSIVRFDSRETTGERWRSNRLRRDTDIVDTAPPTSDRTVAVVHFDGSPVVGDDENWPHYHHPGGMQLVDDVLVVPLETPVSGGPPNMILFLDVSNPEQPTIISRFVPDAAPGFNWSAGLVAVTALADGRYLRLVTGGKNDLVRVYRSNPALLGLRDPSLTWGDPLDVSAATLEEQLGEDWPENGPSPLEFGDAHQTLNFVREGPTDDQLFLVGARNTNSGVPLAEDHIDLYRVDISGGSFVLDKIADRHLDTHATTTDGTLGSGNIANLAAADGFHVTPSGELLFYATEHDNTGPPDDRTVNMGEWRSVRVVRDESPTLDPTAQPGGPYVVPEGGAVELHGRGDPAVSKAWMELFADPDFDDRSHMVDYSDWALESNDDFDQLDGETSDPDNFSDDTSSVRWFAPVGCTLRLNDDDFGDDDFPGDNVLTLPGRGHVVEFPDLESIANDAFDDDMDSSITSVQFLPDCDAYYSAPLDLSWDLDRNGAPETPAADVTFSAAGLDGPTEIGVPLWATHPTDGRRGVAAAAVQVTNVAPTIVVAVVLDSTGAEVGVDTPFVVAGVPATLEATFTDPGVADTQTATVVWGDGTVDVGADLDAFSDASGGRVGELRTAHAFVATGTFEVTLSVVDDDGGTTTVTRTVEVLSPEAVLDEVVDRIDDLLANATGATLRYLLQARAAIDGSPDGRGADGALDHLASDNRTAALTELVAASSSLASAAAAGTDVALLQNLVAQAAYGIALETMHLATVASAPPSPTEQLRLAQAQASIASGAAHLAAGRPVEAVLAFRDAVRTAEPLCDC
jgi:hypothetical protein